MKTSRRNFLKLGAVAAALPVSTLMAKGSNAGQPIVISTWNFGLQANEEAWKILSAGGKALDAVEAGARVPEGDPKETSVGLGGLPDRDGRVTLDACIMDENGNIGSVACLEHIVHPVSVARKVMEKTPHVMLVGEGALQFALANGFKKEKLLTKESEQAWKNWLKNGYANYVTGYHPLFMFVKCLSRLPKRPYFVAGFGLFFGYASGYFRPGQRVADKEMVRFLRREQWKRLLLRPSIWG